MIRALVEALEKAQRESSVNWEAAASMNVENQELKQHIAELESRTGTVKLPPRQPECFGFMAEHFNIAREACAEAIRAAGIQVIEGEGQ